MELSPFVTIEEAAAIAGQNRSTIYYNLEKDLLGVYVKTPTYMPTSGSVGGDAEIFNVSRRLDDVTGIDPLPAYCKLKPEEITWNDKGGVICRAITPVDTDKDIRAAWAFAGGELLLKREELLTSDKEENRPKEMIASTSTAKKRNKNKDIKECRAKAKKYVDNCKEKKEEPSIINAIEIIKRCKSLSAYTDKQIRNWITKKPKIFPDGSSKKGRRKNT